MGNHKKIAETIGLIGWFIREIVIILTDKKAETHTN